MAIADITAGIMLPAAKCIVVNDTLSGAVGPVITQLTGSLAGLIQLLVIFVFVIAAVMSIVLLLSKKGAEWLRKAVFVLALGLAIPAMVLVYNTLRVVFENAC